jgi:hypothetical protein
MLALLLRPILGLLNGLKLRKLKPGDWEAELSETAQELRRELPAVAKVSAQKKEELVAELEPDFNRLPRRRLCRRGIGSSERFTAPETGSDHRRRCSCPAQ